MLPFNIITALHINRWIRWFTPLRKTKKVPNCLCKMREQKCEGDFTWNMMTHFQQWFEESTLHRPFRMFTSCCTATEDGVKTITPVHLAMWPTQAADVGAHLKYLPRYHYLVCKERLVQTDVIKMKAEIKSILFWGGLDEWMAHCSPLPPFPSPPRFW